jgi:hypothetical protein
MRKQVQYRAKPSTVRWNTGWMVEVAGSVNLLATDPIQSVRSKEAEGWLLTETVAQGQLSIRLELDIYPVTKLKLSLWMRIVRLSFHALLSTNQELTGQILSIKWFSRKAKVTRLMTTRRTNREHPKAEWKLELYQNSANGSHWIHLAGQVWTKQRK